MPDTDFLFDMTSTDTGETMEVVLKRSPNSTGYKSTRPDGEAVDEDLNKGVDAYDDITAHMVDNTRHITATERTAWNSKVSATDPRLSDARTPTAHEHAPVDITAGLIADSATVTATRNATTGAYTLTATGSGTGDVTKSGDNVFTGNNKFEKSVNFDNQTLDYVGGISIQGDSEFIHFNEDGTMKFHDWEHGQGKQSPKYDAERGRFSQPRLPELPHDLTNKEYVDDITGNITSNVSALQGEATAKWVLLNDVDNLSRNNALRITALEQLRADVDYIGMMMGVDLSV